MQGRSQESCEISTLFIYIVHLLSSTSVLGKLKLVRNKTVRTFFSNYYFFTLGGGSNFLLKFFK